MEHRVWGWGQTAETMLLLHSKNTNRCLELLLLLTRTQKSLPQYSGKISLLSKIPKTSSVRKVRHDIVMEYVYFVLRLLSDKCNIHYNALTQQCYFWKCMWRTFFNLAESKGKDAGGKNRVTALQRRHKGISSLWPDSFQYHLNSPGRLGPRTTFVLITIGDN